MANAAFRALLGSVNEAASTAGLDTTVSISPQAGDGLLVFVTFKDSGDTDQTVSSVVFNTTENLTKLGESNNTGGSANARHVSAWWLPNPSATTANLVATYSESVLSASIQAFAYTNVEAIGTVSDGDVNTSNATATTTHISLTTDLATTRDNSLGVAFIACQDGTRDPFTPDAGTERADGSTSGGVTNDMSYTVIERAAATPGNYAFGTTTSGAGSPSGAAAIAVELQSAFTPAGLAATMSLGSPTVQSGGDITLTPTGLSMTMSQGSPVLDIEGIGGGVGTVRMGFSLGIGL